jgi:hypothetical protein
MSDSRDTLRATLRKPLNADIDRLASHGIPFSGAAYPEKSAYPPEDELLHYSGNENVAGYCEKAMPARAAIERWARAFSGYTYYAALSQAADEDGAERA